ncbi:hypothetical protein MYA_3123 [Burkholderia sp. KJ006]|jgi:hypothetical protein|nr:hypothetical protein [Burkholderia vietnamiensis]AFJ87483.1 hypothetical protein MYA_3123 [Burkholderia sp. KJ006]
MRFSVLIEMGDDKAGGILVFPANGATPRDAAGARDRVRRLM